MKTIEEIEAELNYLGTIVPTFLTADLFIVAQTMQRIAQALIDLAQLQTERLKKGY